MCCKAVLGQADFLYRVIEVDRVGRKGAGHGVGETSRGRLYPTFARDVLDAAVMAPWIEASWCEELKPIRNPLDVLAQVVLSMCSVEPRDLIRGVTKNLRQHAVIVPAQRESALRHPCRSS